MCPGSSPRPPTLALRLLYITPPVAAAAAVEAVKPTKRAVLFLTNRIMTFPEMAAVPGLIGLSGRGIRASPAAATTALIFD